MNKIIFICVGLFSVSSVEGASISYFPTDMLSAEGSVVDISYLDRLDSQLEGDYQVDVYINNTFWRAMTFNFRHAKPDPDGKLRKDNSGLAPCLTVAVLKEAGIRTEVFPDLQALDDNPCISPGDFIPGAYTLFAFQEMKLTIGIPQAAMQHQSRGYISPEWWDHGINGAWLNYAFNSSHYAGTEHSADRYFMGINSGANLGAWRLHDFRAWNAQFDKTGGSQQVQHIKTWIERPVIPLRSSVMFGENSTRTEMFESTEFTGFTIATDDNMYPDSMRGFAPVVQGVAETNAEVTIIQNGYTLYRTFVSPGAFEISDLPSSRTSNDLEVIIKEANGTVRRFFAPYASVPMMLRKSRMKYSFTAGKYRGRSHSGSAPYFVQSTLMQGVQDYITLYAGGQFSTPYWSSVIGAGFNFGPLGALSADIARSQHTRHNQPRITGTALRLNYSPARLSQGTYLTVGYQYFTDNYRSFNEAMQPVVARYPAGLTEHLPAGTEYASFFQRDKSKRSRLTFNLSQQLNDIGNLFLTGTRQDYWQSREKSTFLQMGFSGSLLSVNYTLNYGYAWLKNNDDSYELDRNISLYLTVPLATLFGRNNYAPTYATMVSSRDNKGHSELQAGISGVLFEDQSLNWAVTQGRTGNGSLNYKGRYGETSTGYSYGNNFHQFNYGQSGSVLLHGDGLTFGQPAGETKVLISSSGVPDVQVENLPGVITDSSGFAIEPYVTAYRENRIALDHASLSDRTEVNNDVIRVIPTKGAIVRATFDVNEGYRILLTLTYNGRPVPFGSVVHSGNRSGIVGDDGEVYLSGLPESGSVSVVWGNNESEQCHASYALSSVNKEEAVARLYGVCK